MAKTTERKCKKEKKVYHTASELYNDLSEIYFDEYYDLSGAKRSKMDPKYDYANLTLDEYDYSEWYKELDNSPRLEGDEENYYTASSTSLSKSDKKEGKGLKILTRNKLLTRSPIVLAQIKAGSNSNNLKNEIRQKVYLLYQHNITKKVYNNLIKPL